MINADLKLKMLFVTGSLFNESSGPFASLIETAKTLYHKGHDVDVVGTYNGNDLCDVSSWAPVSVKYFKNVGPKTFHISPEITKWLKNKVSVPLVSLQSIWLYNNYLTYKWCEERKIPFLITPHGNFNSAALEISKWKKKIAYLCFIKKMLVHASCFHALNYAEYEAIREFGLTQPVAVIPNGVRLVNKPNLGRTFTDNSSICKDELFEKVCLYLGRLHPIKGLDKLIYAWSQLTNIDNRWKLKIVGPDEGGYKTKLMSIVKSLNLGKSVLFLGPAFGEEKSDLFKTADFFVLPSESEGFPMTVLEAMSHGLPVLITDKCNFPEVEEYRGGIVVKPSTHDLEIGLSIMLNLSELERIELGKNAYQLLEKRYQWETIVDQLLGVYRWLILGGNIPSTVIVN